MKLLLVFIAVLGYTQADAGDDIAAAKLFIDCSRKVLDGGLPSIPIPNHNPLIIRNISFGDSQLLYSFNISITNNVLYNLLDFNFTKIDAISYTNPERVAYDYDLYWPKLNFTGNYDVSVKTVLFSTKLQGSFNVILHHTDWTGIFNLTKPGQEDQGIKEHLDDFRLVSKAKDADVIFTGDIDDSVSEGVVKTAVLAVFNNFPASAGDILKDARFNEFWIDHPERINAIIEACEAK